MGQKSKTIILTRKDFEFVDKYMTNNHIPKGKGIRYLFEDFLNEYKKVK